MNNPKNFTRLVNLAEDAVLTYNALMSNIPPGNVALTHKEKKKVCDDAHKNLKVFLKELRKATL